MTALCIASLSSRCVEWTKPAVKPKLNKQTAKKILAEELRIKRNQQEKRKFKWNNQSAIAQGEEREYSDATRDEEEKNEMKE